MLSLSLAYWFLCQCDWFLCQCVASSARCDKRPDCRDGSDEELCDLNREIHIENVAAFPPAVVHLDGRGHYTIEPLASFSQCPETHFLCQGWSYCLPLPTPSFSQPFYFTSFIHDSDQSIRVTLLCLQCVTCGYLILVTQKR